MTDHYPPLKERLLPGAPPFRSAFGVGIVVLGLAIGSGELILWPYLTVKFGLGILWGALWGIVMEYFINQEVARNALATGESFFTSAARVLHWTIPFWLVSAVFLYIWPGWAGAMGATLMALFGWGTANFWAWMSLLAVLIFVFSGKVAYETMELAVKVIAAVFFALLLIVSFLNLTPAILKEAFWGLLNFGWLPAGMNIGVFMGAVVFAGAGGLLNVCISLWYRDKKSGMGAYIGQIKNPITSESQAIETTGYYFVPNAENMRHWKKWMQIAYFDQGVLFALLGFLGLLLVSLNAYAVLSPFSVTPNGINIIRDQAQIFGNLWGPSGSALFLIVVFLELFSTLWVVLDVFTRIVGDIIYTNSKTGPFKKYFSWAKEFSAHSIYYVLFASLVIINAILIPFGEPLSFLVISAVLGGVAMAVYTPILLFINNCRLPEEIRPSLLTNIVLVLASAFFIYFSILTLIDLII